MPLAIGVDAANLARDRRGIGRYVRATLREWAHPRFAGRVRVTPLTGFFRAWRAGRLGLDLIWYPWNGMTWASDVPSIVTLHDLWPFVSPAKDAARRAREQRHYLLAAGRAAHFIAVSSNTAREAVEFLGVDPQRISVVPHGVAPLTDGVPAPARFAAFDRYVLFVGEVEPRKDIPTLAAAMARLPEALRATTGLVLVGRGAERVPDDPSFRIARVGEAPDMRLAALYAGAAALAFPSRYEGFGLPVLEAMRYGIPVVASDAPAVMEAGGDAAAYFRTGDAHALCVALARVLQDGAYARALGEAGRVRATAMTQLRCAEQTLDVFERVARSATRATSGG